MRDTCALWSRMRVWTSGDRWKREPVAFAEFAISADFRVCAMCMAMHENIAARCTFSIENSVAKMHVEFTLWIFFFSIFALGCRTEMHVFFGSIGCKWSICSKNLINWRIFVYGSNGEKSRQSAVFRSNTLLLVNPSQIVSVFLKKKKRLGLSI